MNTQPNGNKEPSRLRQWRNSLDNSLAKRKLESELRRSFTEIGTLTDKADANLDWVKNCKAFLVLAEESRKFGDVDQGWRHMKAANCWSLYGLFDQDRIQFNARALSVFREGTSTKIDSSRRKQEIKDLLSIDGQFIPVTKRSEIGKVFAAQHVLDDYQNNIYDKSYVLKGRLAFLNLVSLLAIGGWIYMAPELKEMKTIAGQMSPQDLWLIIVLAGALGAITSGYTRSLGSSGAKVRIPAQIAEGYISLARMFLGAGSAIGVTMLLLSGLINLGEVLNLGLILAVAFISGFTEKLLQNAIDKSVAVEPKNEQSTNEESKKYEPQSIE
jgi:hypothetical protein